MYQQMLIHVVCNVNTYHAAVMSRRHFKFGKKCHKIWNLVTMFRTTMENTFKQVQTCLVLVH